MKRNVCGLDRVARLTLGPALILTGFLGSRRPRREADDVTVSGLHIAIAYAGAELLVTGLLQWCPGNYLLGVDTCHPEWWRPARSPLRERRQASHSSGFVS